MKGAFFVAERLFFKQGKKQGKKSGKGNPVFAASLGVAISLIPLVTVDHVADAMIEGIVARYREIASSHFQIHSWKRPDIEQWQELEGKARELKSVRAAWIERRSWGLARANELREALTIRALPADMPDRDTVFVDFLDFYEGSWDLNTPHSVLLGRSVGRQLNTHVGDEIRILTTRKLANGQQIPRVTKFTVRGIFSSGYQDLDKSWVFISLNDGWEILSPENTQTFLGGKLLEKELDVHLAGLDKLFDKGWKVYSWRDINFNLLSNLENTRGILLVIMALIIIIAILNVLNSLMMLAIERKNEIGILKCFGVNKRSIVQTFILVGSFVAITGCIAGSAAGIAISYYVNQIIAGIEFAGNLLFSSGSTQILPEGHYLQHIPIRIRWDAIIIFNISTFLLAVVASVAPALYVARLKPLEILRRY